jgi:hypothetical protein
VNSIQYEELCRFYVSRMLGVDIHSIHSARIPNPLRPDLPPYGHQIDLYWETEDAISRYLSIANAKWRGTSKVDQPDVLLLQQVRQKVAAHKALVLTNTGFTRGAIAAARDDGIGLHLVIPSFDSSLLPGRSPTTIQRTLAEIASRDGRAFVADVAIKSFNLAGPEENSESIDDPDVEHWYIRQLEKRLAYLRFIATSGYAVAESTLIDLENEIAQGKGALSKRSTGQ